MMFCSDGLRAERKHSGYGFRAQPCGLPWNDERKKKLDSLTYLLIFVGALAGGFVSGLAGFGTGLMALGIWLYVLPPRLRCRWW